MLVYLANGLVPVVSDVGHVTAILGDYVDLCVMVGDQSNVQSWVDAVRDALAREPGSKWFDRRDEFLATMTTEGLCEELFAPETDKDGVLK
ncbi:hypothetical protein [Rhodococcoides corynebacterioides]|uniref:hypothetical protein n=1 Tax=Rhodococcoides corynebacterioides TaxID=53972 RepID=UPI003ADDADBC